MTSNLDKVVQLHEEIYVFYSVTEYTATLYTDDGNKPILEAMGETIEEAIQNLDMKAGSISHLPLQEIRKLPRLEQG